MHFASVSFSIEDFRTTMYLLGMYKYRVREMSEFTRALLSPTPLRPLHLLLSALFPIYSLFNIKLYRHSTSSGHHREVHQSRGHRVGQQCQVLCKRKQGPNHQYHLPFHPFVVPSLSLFSCSSFTFFLLLSSFFFFDFLFLRYI